MSISRAVIVPVVEGYKRRWGGRARRSGGAAAAAEGAVRSGLRAAMAAVALAS